jgi:uncharacterized protein with von Willebrand factor type A (vWA) domain
MSEYVQKIDSAEVKGPLDGKLEGPELSAFRRLVMQLRWPAHLVMPEFLFATSDLAQRVSQSTFSDLKHASHVLKQMKAAAENGEASLSIRPLKGTPLFVSFLMHRWERILQRKLSKGKRILSPPLQRTGVKLPPTSLNSIPTEFHG